MTGALGISGWVVAFALVAVVRRRLELVARAEHELRGPVTVLGLAAERLPLSESAPLELELQRLRAGLADLAAARRGRRARPRPSAVRLEVAARGALALGARGRRAVVDWQAGPTPIRADPGRLAQALGNLVANAAEHGEGPVELLGRRTPGGIRVEVRNRKRRGLAIAADAARDSGGELRFEDGRDDARAVLELPLSPQAPRPPAA